VRLSSVPLLALRSRLLLSPLYRSLLLPQPRQRLSPLLRLPEADRLWVSILKFIAPISGFLLGGLGGVVGVLVGSRK